MRRVTITQRPNLKQSALAHGYPYDAAGGVPYWDETAYYSFTLRQIEDHLEGPAEEIERLCFEVLNRAVADETVFQRLRIPEAYWNYIAESWRKLEKDLLGRFDFSYNGSGPAKLLEYNADTPTTLYEAAVFQWEWLEHAIDLGLVPEGADQFNLVHEFLLEAVSKLELEGPLHTACLKNFEDDRSTVEYLEYVAEEAGVKTMFLSMEEIGIDADGHFTDLDDRVIETLFKLYPWEWLMEEKFGRYMPKSGVRFIEPPWKAVLSNKGLLPLLWEMFEGHPNLLPAFFEGDPGADELAGTYVRKPLLSRQGTNIEIIRDGRTQSRSDGPYGGEDHIVQALHPLPEFAGNYPLVGCWLVASKAVGMCIREDRTLVTGKDARFIPHVILD